MTTTQRLHCSPCGCVTLGMTCNFLPMQHCPAKPDAVHLTYAIGEDRVCLTKNYDDYLILHNLIKRAQGHHPGIFVVRQDNDPTRDLTARGIVGALRNLEAAGVAIRAEYVVLNH